MFELKTVSLFLITAVAEIVGCYLPYLWLKEGKSIWLLVPAALSLALFAWLLSLHPAAAGRVYAAYGGAYIFVAILWMWAVDGIKPTALDIAGSLVALLGMAIIMFAPRNAQSAAVAASSPKASLSLHWRSTPASRQSVGRGVPDEYAWMVIAKRATSCRHGVDARIHCTSRRATQRPIP